MAIALILAALAPPAGRADFLESAAALGVADSLRVSTGVAWSDYDRDGDQDLLVASYDGPLRLYRNDGGLTLTDVAQSLGLGAGPPLRAMGAAWGDYDKDGDPDLYVAGDSTPSRLFRQAAGGGFADAAGLLGVADPGRATAAVWVDLEPDGDLDLYVAARDGPNRLYRSDVRGGPFAEAAAELGLDEAASTEAAAFGDFDRDGDPDLFLSNFDGPHRLLRNDGAVFTDVTAASGIVTDGIGQGAAWGDYDRDGDLDLAHALCVDDRLYRNDGGGRFTEVAAEVGVAGPGESRAVAWADYDLDGWLDLFVGRMERPLLFRNTGAGFVEVGEAEGLLDDESTYGAAFGDLEGDGAPDLALAAAAGPNRLYRNRGRTGHWLGVRLSAFAAPADGVGIEVRVVAGGAAHLRAVDGGSGLLSQGPPVAMFGLGGALVADTLEVRWPLGLQVLTGVAADRTITVEEDVVDSLGVALLGFLPLAAPEPWVADVWGYETPTRDYALVAAGDRLVVADVTDPAAPAVAAEVPATGVDLKDVKTFGVYAYCVNENGTPFENDGRIQVVDLTLPQAAQTVAAFGDSAGYHNCFVDVGRGLLYAAGHRNDEALQIYDLAADPLDPPLLARYGNFYGHDVHARGDRALLFSINNGFFELLDVGDASNPRPLARVSYPDAFSHSGWLSADRRHAFTCDEAVGGHLRVWDLTDPGAVVQVAEFEVDPRSSIHNAQREGDLVYLSYYDQGMRVIDARDPAAPVEVGHFRASRFSNGSCSFSVFRGNWGVYPHTRSGNVYFTDMCGGGLYVGRAAAAPRPGVDGGTPEAGGAAVRFAPSAPNPFNPETRLSWTLARAGPVRLEVFDAGGRLVRRLVSARLDAGPHEVAWDGRDGGGRRLPSGVYVARVAAGGGAASCRLVLVR